MSKLILAAQHLGSPPWPTLDPFLFCVHHLDTYPQGRADMGPQASLQGRQIGHDFAGKDGWRMYHGDVVPGFPRHPHRGFETITIVRRGLIDHSDSLGATARFGPGDTQWMTAGSGVVHSEMFPLVNGDADNPLELFQIWLNLPARDKMVDPYFTMLWNHTVPKRTFTDPRGRKTVVTVVAGALDDAKAPPPPPNSWASRDEAALRIFTIDLEPGATWTLPPAPAGVTRVLYQFEGGATKVGELEPDGRMLLQLAADQPAPMAAGLDGAGFLVLEARPIAEPVAHHGPFVMNTRAELEQAYSDYRRTGFGGWPWTRDDPVHDRDADRFAIHADGRRETPPA